MKHLLFTTFLLLAIYLQMNAQITIPLYVDKIPNSKPSKDDELTENKDGITIVSKISKPTLSVFLPAKGNACGTAVIIFPGGGYWVNAISHEGTDVAKRFAAAGVAAFVVKYRIPDSVTMIDKEIGPLQDAQQAILTVRNRAAEWSVKPDRIGIMGFSAGGHLASTVGTHFSTNTLGEPGNFRPDFMMLIYPVITFQNNVGHLGSRDQLIGKKPSKEKIDLYSNDLHVNVQTPPAFLVHASDDNGVKPENSIIFYQALLKNKVKAEMHLYQNGGHGFGMNNKTTKDDWFDRGLNWLRANGWL
jgi:acetyl esterase/lipase